MRLIDADVLAKEAGKLWSEMPDGEELSKELMKAINQAPTVDAVPLGKLCEFLDGIYGTPCQLGEIECYPQCEPDGEGMCLGMRSNDVTCWKSYLTKWMEGLDGD